MTFIFVDSSSHEHPTCLAHLHMNIAPANFLIPTIDTVKLTLYFTFTKTHPKGLF